MWDEASAIDNEHMGKKSSKSEYVALRRLSGEGEGGGVARLRREYSVRHRGGVLLVRTDRPH